MGLCSVVVQFLIAASTLMKKFEPGSYLEWSNKWTLKGSLKDLMILLIIHSLLMVFCFYFGQGQDTRAFHKMAAAIYGLLALIILGLTFLIQIRIVIAENKKKIQVHMNNLFKRNTVAPGHENGEVPDDNDEDDEDQNEVGLDAKHESLALTFLRKMYQQTLVSSPCSQLYLATC